MVPEVCTGYKLRLYILLPILASIKLYAQPKKKIPKKNVGKAKIRFLGSLKRLNWLALHVTWSRFIRCSKQKMGPYLLRE